VFYQTSYVGKSSDLKKSSSDHALSRTSNQLNLKQGLSPKDHSMSTDNIEAESIPAAESTD